MNTALRSTPQQQPRKSSVNPFAAALAEARGGQGMQTKINSSADNFGDDNFNFEDQQRKLEEQRKRERLRMELHRRINPVETTDIFNAQQERITKQINEIRNELRMLVQEVKEFDKETDITIIKNVAEPGTDGTYFFRFFEKLRAFIMMLRQKIHSARTWLNASQAKQKKKRAKGLEISGQMHEQTATIYDRMTNNERSTFYSGS